MSKAPRLLVTIDTEPDDQWAIRPEVTTENVQKLPGLQGILDRHGVRPTYFVSYAVARDPRAAAILGRIHSEGKCEIGAHLHPWGTPPHFKIRGEVWQSHPYLFQYPEEVQRQKFAALHAALTEVFGFEPTSYRAGRYGFDAFSVRLLREFGYKVDSSVTPMIRWEEDEQAGTPGPDFRRAPLGVYELSENDVCAPGRSGIIEVPVSIGYTRRLPRFARDWLKMQRPENLIVRGLGKLFGIRRCWFRPFINVPFGRIESAARWLLQQDSPFLNMMFHSSELIPNSQWCRTEPEIRLFLQRIEDMITLAEKLGCETGMTLEEFGRERREA